MPKQTQSQSTQIKQRTATYHGNRKLQHFRRRRRQTNRMNNPFIDVLMNTLTVMQQFHPNDDDEEEEEEEDDDEQIDNKETCLNQHQSMEENPTRQRRTAYLSIDKWKLSAKLIPNYSKFRPDLFKHVLGKAIPRYRQQIHQYLTNPKLLSFIQQYAHLMCTIFQLEMEKDYWQHAINGLLSAVHWLSKMPKDLTKRYSISWDYPRTEYNIRHRQRVTENKLEQTNRGLHLHRQQYSSCWSISDETSTHQIMTIISQALIVVIQNGLAKLHTKFEEKKILMQFDVYDVYLLKSFYDLNPIGEQKLSVERLWRAKRKFCQRNFHQTKIDSSDKEQVTVQDDISSMFNENNRLYIDYHHQQDQASFLASLDNVMRTIIETGLANIEQRTQQIIAFDNNSSYK